MFARVTLYISAIVLCVKLPVEYNRLISATSSGLSFIPLLVAYALLEDENDVFTFAGTN